MHSRKQIEEKYNNLLKKVATDSYYQIDLTNRVNCYVCNCGHITKTRDIDAGVTPMMFNCEKCGGFGAMSTGFKDIVPNRQPTFEWYRPSLKKLLKMRNVPGMVDHILNGGLDYRKI